MSDLTITVTAPGATSAAAQVKGARTETEKAAMAAKKLADANAHAAKDSKIFADGMKREAQALFETTKRTNDLARARQRAEQSATGGGGGGGMGSGGHESSAKLIRALGKASGSGVGALVGGVGERFGFLSSLGAGAVTAGAAMAVLAAAVKISVSALGLHKESLERSALAAAKWTEVQVAAAKTQESQGLNAAGTQGASLRALMIRGGQGLVDTANKFTPMAGSASDAQQAVLALSGNGTKTLDKDMENAGLLSRAAGISLSEAAKSLSEFTSRDLRAVGAILSDREGKRVSGIATSINDKTLSDNNPLVKALDKINQNSGNIDLIGQGQISSNGVVGSNSALFAAMDPTAAANLAVFTDMSTKLDVLNKINEGMNGAERLLDRLVNGKASAAGQLGIALDESAAFGAAQ